MNSLAGPKLTQVFETALFDDVLSNLTNPSRLLARLRHVKVLSNSYLGVNSYTVDELMILSNARSEEFVDSFKDPEVKKHLDPSWPDRLAVSMDEFNANMMCEYQWWKLGRHASDIASFFQNARDAEMLV